MAMAPLLATAVWLSWLPSHSTLSALTQFTSTCSSSESSKRTRGLIPPDKYQEKQEKLAEVKNNFKILALKQQRALKLVKERLRVQDFLKE